MKSLFFTLTILIASILASQFVSCDDDQASQVRIVINSGNITMEIVGRNITRLIINGYDLKSLVSEVNKLDVYQRYLLHLLEKQNSRIDDLSILLNTTIIRINNNTILIMRNRRDIVLLAVVLNRTINKLTDMNKTLAMIFNTLDQLKSNITSQQDAIDTLKSTIIQYEYKVNSLQDELNTLNKELESLRTKYEDQLNEAHNKINRLMQSIFLILVVFTILFTALLIKVRTYKNKSQ